MKDEQTGSWWQQVTGEAIQGPLKGCHLKLVNHDEVNFATWKQENPQGRVLQPESAVEKFYEPADWEERYSHLPVVTPTSDGPSPRTLVYGLTTGSASKAYTDASLQQQSPIIDRVGNTPVLLVIDSDRKSVRAFDRALDGRELEFFYKAGASKTTLVDSETGSEWSFAGKSTSGPLKGRELTRIPILADYWFDWKTYHPDTSIY